MDAGLRRGGLAFRRQPVYGGCRGEEGGEKAAGGKRAADTVRQPRRLYRCGLPRSVYCVGGSGRACAVGLALPEAKGAWEGEGGIRGEAADGRGGRAAMQRESARRDGMALGGRQGFCRQAQGNMRPFPRVLFAQGAMAPRPAVSIESVAALPRGVLGLGQLWRSTRAPGLHRATGLRAHDPQCGI